MNFLRLITGISKKVIYSSFLFISFLQPSKSAESPKLNRNINSRNINLTCSKLYQGELTSSISKKYLSNNTDYNYNYVKFLKKNLDTPLIAKAENQQELIIQSDKQSEINNVIYA